VPSEEPTPELEPVVRALSLPAIRDTYYDRYRTTQSFGDKGRIHIRTNADGSAYGLVLFDLSSLPPNAIIEEAKLTLQVVDRSNAASIKVRVYAAPRPWDEKVTADQMADAHLNLADTSPWDERSVSADDQVIVWSVTTIVQQWAYGAQNHGFLLSATDSGNRVNTTCYFASKEWTEGPQLRPTLSIVYAIDQ
jgi:hypothetical protein